MFIWRFPKKLDDVIWVDCDSERNIYGAIFILEISLRKMKLGLALVMLNLDLDWVCSWEIGFWRLQLYLSRILSARFLSCHQ